MLGPLREKPESSLSSDCDLSLPPFFRNKITYAPSFELLDDFFQTLDLGTHLESTLPHIKTAA
jgi:hypothetical protein